MRRLLPLLALPLLLASKPALAHEDDDNDYEPDDYRQKAELGIAVEAFRASPTIGTGPGMTGGYIGAHGRLGRRVALGFGLEQSYGDDPSGWRRYDLAWNLPKLYLYLNSRSKTQFYVTTGLDMRVSHFDDAPDKPLPAGTPWGFMYFGTFAGVGMDHRIDKNMALRLELRSFMRGRASSRGPNDAPLDQELNDKTRGARGAVLSLGLVFF